MIATGLSPGYFDDAADFDMPDSCTDRIGNLGILRYYAMYTESVANLWVKNLCGSADRDYRDRRFEHDGKIIQLTLPIGYRLNQGVMFGKVEAAELVDDKIGALANHGLEYFGREFLDTGFDLIIGPGDQSVRSSKHQAGQARGFDRPLALFSKGMGRVAGRLTGNLEQASVDAAFYARSIGWPHHHLV